MPARKRACSLDLPGPSTKRPCAPSPASCPSPETEDRLTHALIADAHHDDAPLPLTADNLRELDGLDQHNLYESESESDRGSDRSSTMSGNTNLLVKKDKLAAYDIMVNRDEDIPYPPTVKELVDWVTNTKRDPDVPLSPHSKNIAAEWLQAWNAEEREALYHLNRALSAPPRDGLPIRELQDEDFVKDSVPRPARCDNSDMLAEAMKDIGAPANPKPDVTFGYPRGPKSPFGRQEPLLYRKDIENFTGIAPRVLFPFFTQEWKACATGGTHYGASLQSARNNAALSHALRRFFLACNVEFTDADIAHFSATMDGSSVWIWVHWHRETEDQLTWESRIVKQFFFREEVMMADFRRMVRNIFDHAVGKRLDKIKKALDSYAAMLPTRKASPRKGSPTKQPRDAAGSGILNGPPLTPTRAQTVSAGGDEGYHDPEKSRARMASERADLTPPSVIAKKSRQGTSGDSNNNG